MGCWNFSRQNDSNAVTDGTFCFFFRGHARYCNELSSRPSSTCRWYGALLFLLLFFIFLFSFYFIFFLTFFITFFTQRSPLNQKDQQSTNCQIFDVILIALYHIDHHFNDEHLLLCCIGNENLKYLSS